MGHVEGLFGWHLDEEYFERGFEDECDKIRL